MFEVRNHTWMLMAIFAQSVQIAWWMILRDKVLHPRLRATVPGSSACHREMVRATPVSSDPPHIDGKLVAQPAGLRQRGSFRNCH